MADRILTWYIEEPKGTERQGATFCLDKDYVPVCIRAYAGKDPDTNLEIDILDDGVSILSAPAVIKAGRNGLDFEEIDGDTMEKYSFVSLNLSASGAKKITVQLELDEGNDPEE